MAKLRRDSTGTRLSTEKCRQIDAQARRSARNDKQRWYDNCANELEDASKMNNQRRVFQLTKKMAGKSLPQPISMKDKEGNTITDVDKVKDRWRKHSKNC